MPNNGFLVFDPTFASLREENIAQKKIDAGNKTKY